MIDGITSFPKSCLLPGTVADTHLHASDRGRAGPGHASNRNVAAVDDVAPCRLRNQAAHPLQGHRLPHHLPLALPLVDVPIRLEEPLER